MHFAREELYRAGMNWPRQPHAHLGLLFSYSHFLSCPTHSWTISKAKLSGNRGGELSPKKLLQRRSASLLVIIPHRLEQKFLGQRTEGFG